MIDKLEITGATLLSAKEAKNLNKEILKADENWWLRSCGHRDGLAACVFGDRGYADYFGYLVNYSYGVRPALEISNLESSNLKIGDTITFGEHDFTIVSDKYALCNEIVDKRVFREDYVAEDANDYEASDIKKFVDDWFIRIKERAEKFGLKELEEQEEEYER